MNHLREDVHIHASAQRVYRHITSSRAVWLPRAFRHVSAHDDTLCFELALPLRRERARLAVTTSQSPSLLVLERDSAADEGGVIDSLTWALHEETPEEVHVTLEAGYRPAGGPLGALLESALYEPLRRQAFRDALWRLKRFVEADDAGGWA